MVRVAQRIHLAYEGIYVDEHGQAIPPHIMIQGLVEHLERWARLGTKHGLILLEVHCLPPKVVAEFRDESENLHFDAYHAFSGQYLVEADVFLISAAEAGLLPKAEFFRRYPSVLPFSRITLNCFEKKPYQIRLAHHDDLLALLDLEDQCQPETERASAAMLQERIEQYPTGHCILSVDGDIVRVIYTQRHNIHK